MANKVHLQRLAEGVTAWNKWREENPDIDIDLSDVCLVKEISKRHRKQVERILAPLISLLVTLFLDKYQVIENLVKLISNNLSLDLTLSATVNLLLFFIIRTFIFIIITFTVVFSLHPILNIAEQKQSLKNINFKAVNLYKTDLRGIDLSFAELSETNLEYSNLSNVEAIGTNFSQAKLTGICIANWNINSSTNLNNVKCDYIYEFFNEKVRIPEKRRPSNSNRNFKPNEFTLTYQVNEVNIELKNYVNLTRLQELKSISNLSNKFDLSKLIQYCEELNKSFDNDCLLSVPMLVRAITDHVPPIFEQSEFKHVVANYKGSKSFKESMKNLNESLRKIADSHLHTHIRSKETLPNQTQVNFSQDLDVLLGEIYRILK